MTGPSGPGVESGRWSLRGLQAGRPGSPGRVRNGGAATLRSACRPRLSGVPARPNSESSGRADGMDCRVAAASVAATRDGHRFGGALRRFGCGAEAGLPADAMWRRCLVRPVLGTVMGGRCAFGAASADPVVRSPRGAETGLPVDGLRCCGAEAGLPVDESQGPARSDGRFADWSDVLGARFAVLTVFGGGQVERR